MRNGRQRQAGHGEHLRKVSCASEQVDGLGNAGALHERVDDQLVAQPGEDLPRVVQMLGAQIVERVHRVGFLWIA